MTIHAAECNSSISKSVSRMGDQTMKHTPAPWYVSEPFNPSAAGESYTIRRTGRDRTKWNGYVAEVLCSSPNAEANAKLLASAPDLLDALKAARDQTLAIQHSQETRLNDIFDVVTAAIAKVEGAP